MTEWHDKLATKGRQEALMFTETEPQRRAVEAAFSFMGDEVSNIGFLFAGWCQTALPHRRLPDDEIWRVQTDYVHLMIEPGSVSKPEGPVRIGVPYGSRARLILLFLQSEAIRTNSPQIELGRSLRVWLGKLGVPIGGKSFKDVREQAMRISRCRMSFEIQRGNKVGFINQNIIDTALFGDDNSSLVERVELSPRFFAELKHHPVPLQEAAIRALSNNSQALDIYCWLAYRLHAVKGDCMVSWTALMAQFGSGYATYKNFRRKFPEGLMLALAVYPSAQADIVPEGLKLIHSPPPVPPRI